MREVFAALLVAVLAACAGCGPADEAESQGTESVDSEEEGVAKGVSFMQNAFGVTFTNGDGAWTIYTGCFGPKKRGGANVSVGPGYIARVVLKKATPVGKVVIDDEGPLHDPNGNVIGFTHPGYATLGGFAWHHSRGNAPYAFNGNNAWEIAGRICAEDHGGFGVSGSTVVDGPRLTSAGAGALTIDVAFTDPWMGGAPLVTLRYVYRFYDNVVKMWAVVTQHCGGGNCGTNAPGPAYIGEPKFVSGVSGGGYRRMVILNDKGQIATNSFSTHGSCLWTGAQPTKATGQCDGDHRVRARFDYGSVGSGTNGACDATSHLCLNTVMQAYPVDPDGGVTPGKPRAFWDNESLGLDRWARLSASRGQVNAADSAEGGALWSCHGGSTASDQNRRWELVGLEKDAAGRFKYASFYFHAWESGTGAYDCEPLSRRFGPEGERFAIHAEYSLNDGWSLK